MKHTALAPLLVASLWTSTFAVWGETQAPATTAPVSADFTNSFYALALSPDRPAFTRFSIDSLGKRALERNPVLTDQRTTPVAQLRQGEAGRFEYKNTETPDSTKPLWEMQCGEKSFSLKSHFVPGSSLPPFTLAIDQKANHATLLGLMKPGERRMQLPCVLHLPDMGSARITCNVPNQKVDYDARRYVRPSFVHVSLPPATAEHPEVEYTFHVEAFHPPIAGIEKNSLFDGFRRSYLNMFQVNPRVQMLANNSSSDPVPFTLFIYAEMAAHAPPLAPGLTCLDLVRMTLDQYLSGALGYGMKGYAVKPMDADLIAWKTPWTSLDTTPSLVLSACIYVERSKDETWARLHYPELATWTRDMLLGDKDGNGLVEYPRTGNLGDRPTPDNRPANWWDTINFGHEDAYSNALVFRTCSKFSDLARKLGHADDAKFFSEKATKLRAAYLPAFLNPSTGVLAGWKSADGKLHDYWFTFVSGVAITYGLVDKPDANRIMDHLLKKMDEVGYNNFHLGLPGNLIPVVKADYCLSNWPNARDTGEPSQDDGLDAFQRYENGGATGCYSYFTIKALYDLGRIDDARRIFHPMLASYATGDFQGFCADGKSKDWRDWNGGCFGYEGLLVDNYLPLLAVLDDAATTAP